MRAAALPRLLGLLREGLYALVNPYRPYKHYMRGPGPKMPAQGVAARGEGGSDGGAGTSAPRALIEITDRIEQ